MEQLTVLSIGERVAEYFAVQLQGSPNQLITLFIAMLPIVELRASIPIAILTLHLSWPEAVLFSIIGNMIPIPFILLLLGPVSRFLSRWSMFDRFFRWLFARTLRKSRAVERYEAIGLILFVAIPLPVTGAWTGSVAAYLFGLPMRRSLICIFLGVCISATAVTLLTLGSLGAVRLFS